jgi:hypothetical protein
MERVSIGVISAGRGLLPYLIAFLFVLNAIAPINSISWAAPHRNDAGWSVDKFDVRPLCSAKADGQDSPAHRHQEHGECICCASSARDNLIAIAASLLEASYFLTDLAPSSKAYLDYEIVSWRVLGWMSAWSSRAPPAV